MLSLLVKSISFPLVAGRSSASLNKQLYIALLNVKSFFEQNDIENPFNEYEQALEESQVEQ